MIQIVVCVLNSMNMNSSTWSWGASVGECSCAVVFYRVGRSYVWHLPVDGRFEEERMHLAVIMEVPLGMCRLARKRQLCFRLP